ncbi:MAG: phage minor capsid protein, partial [Bacteroides sp.]|nr:phage minor capsid protein [Bacteroides sp.]
MDALEQLNLAAPIVSTYNEIEETILCHIAEQLAADPDAMINATSEWRIKMLAQMGRVNRETAKIIASKVGKIPSDIQQVVQSSIDKVLSEHGLEMNGNIEDSIAAALKNYELQAVKDKYNQVNTVMQYKAKQAYVNGINSAADKLLRKKQKALENSGEYLDILNKNAMATVLGEKSRTEAIRETIAEMSRKGIPAFVDKTGREWSPEAYVDMDIRNTAKNAALAAEFASLDELGQDIVLISSHSGARPLCAPYQGKLYSRSGKSGTVTDAKGKTHTYTPLSETSFGKPAGLLGINCGHRMRGVSEGTFIVREKEFDGEETSEEYRKVQQQRALEREVRKKKTEANMYEAAGDTDAARDLRMLAQLKERELRAYCGKEGLRYRRDRTEVYGF